MRRNPGDVGDYCLFEISSVDEKNLVGDNSLPAYFRGTTKNITAVEEITYS